MSSKLIPLQVELAQEDYEQLESFAHLRGEPIEELGRLCIVAQLEDMLDPTFEQRLEAKKQSLLAAADAIRKRREQGES